MDSRLETALGLKDPCYWYIGPSWRGELETVDVGMAKDAGYGVYFCPNEMGQGRNAAGHRRFRENVERRTCLFVDLDDGTKDEQLARLRGYHLPPSAVVESGRGYHAYWFLAEDPGPEAWDLKEARLIRDLGGDPAAKDPSRLLRVPGSWHSKDGSEPFEVRIRRLKEDMRYFGHDFPSDRPKIHRETSGEIVWRKKLSPRVLTPGMRHGGLVRACAWYFKGISPSEVESARQAVKEWYYESCTEMKKGWENEVDDFIDGWLRAKEGV